MIDLDPICHGKPRHTEDTNLQHFNLSLMIKVIIININGLTFHLRDKNHQAL